MHALLSYPRNAALLLRTVHALCLVHLGTEMRLLLPHEREAMIYDVLCQHPDLQAQYETYHKAEQALNDHEAKHEDHTSLGRPSGSG